MNEVNIIIADLDGIASILHLDVMVAAIKTAGFKPKLLFGSKITSELLNDSAKLEFIQSLM